MDGSNGPSALVCVGNFDWKAVGHSYDWGSLVLLAAAHSFRTFNSWWYSGKAGLTIPASCSLREAGYRGCGFGGAFLRRGHCNSPVLTGAGLQVHNCPGSLVVSLLPGMPCLFIRTY